MKTENKIIITNMPETKEVYETPIIEIAEVKVEQGVQMSPPPGPGDDDPGGPTW